MAWMRSAWIWAIVILALHPAKASAEDPQAPRTPQPVQAPAEARDSPSEAITLRVMTFNVWYGGEQVSFARVAEAIRLAEADIVGVQEPDGQLYRIAAAAGFPFIDYRRNIISRYPLFDSGAGERMSAAPSTYGTVALDADALHAFAMVRPGEVVAVANTHLTSDPYGPHAAQRGELAEAIAIEQRLRVPEAQPFARLAEVAARGIPVFLTGDFNSPSPLDWTQAAVAARGLPTAVEWPATGLLLAAGLRDSFREAHPDPVARPGFTWTAGMPAPYVPAGELLDRIDFVWTAGPTRTLESRIVGEPGGAGVDIAVAPYPSDHRAVVSTFAVTPAPAPPLVVVEPHRVVAGESFFLRAFLPGAEQFTALVVPRGAGADRALAGVVDETRSYRTGIRLGTDNLAPGGYDAILLAADGAVAARNRFEVVAADHRPALMIADPVLAPGEPLSVRWSGAPGHRFDWIAVAKAGDANVIAPLIWHYTNALLAGETRIALVSEGEPLPPGDYEARLMRDDSYTSLARAAFTITAR
jgi:endonuclease/exonuclease/phosphatase family metal-dependent hydrolase